MPQLRPPFSTAWDFIALRPIDTEDGRIERGQPFPKSTVPPRRLQLMYDALHIDPVVPGWPDPRPDYEGELVPADHYIQKPFAAACANCTSHDDSSFTCLGRDNPGCGMHRAAPPHAPPCQPASGAVQKTAKSLGQGKWQVVAGDVVIHAGPLTKQEAQALASEA